MNQQPSFFLVKGKVQHYNWGGTEFLPQLLNEANNAAKPYAEYWLGSHPNFPSSIYVGAEEKPLNVFIEEDKTGVLGSATQQRFGSLPFLFKLLDVRNMLSIQVHPNLQQAAEGFAAENKAGVSPQAPHRNYKDENHKPELMVALSDFWLLHGFKPEEQLKETLQAVSELTDLLPYFKDGDYKGLYEFVMEPANEAADQILIRLKDRVTPLYASNALDKSHPDFWAARALQTYPHALDRGVFSIYFFNLLHLKRGEGIFQDAGLPHAYLEGQNVEIMANSDNVLRAGLTDKHIDIPELLKLVRFEPTHPQIIASNNAAKTVYFSPAAEFELSRYQLAAAQKEKLLLSEVALVFCLSGSVQIQDSVQEMKIAQGQAILAKANASLHIKTDSYADIFIATVPSSKN